ncbi:MAG: hypothetical protein NC037_00205 [Bacteroides sp.]|nr:hypothetical protein [Bacillota bacterium]MCM1393759.1 hypothetical protein [[Eubacterium] siraeum]MCM1454940.1 hypothetical protein [Bacteroides sp.]
MLTVRFENNSDAREIYRALGVEGEPFGSNFVMYDEKTPVALWRMRIVIEDEPVGIIERIFFADGVDEGDKTFFLHAMFFKLIEGAPIRLRVEGEKPEFEKFGFEVVNGNMEAYSNEINLHYMCGGRYKG